MISEIQTLLDEYVAWLKQKTSLRQIDEWVEITNFPLTQVDRSIGLVEFAFGCQGKFVV